MDPDCNTGLVPHRGGVIRVTLPALPTMPVWVFRPEEETKADRLIVAVHGISRTSRDQLEQFQALAEHLGCCLLAPEFGRESFPGYQKMGKNAAARADLALNSFLLAWQAERRISGVKIHLFGYSGGAQFAHRYALLYPTKLLSLVISSAGWYTFPDQANFPYGLKNWPLWLGRPKLEPFLQLPVMVLVGNHDVLRDSSLRKSQRLDQQQGENRLIRARRWVEAVAGLQQAEAMPRTVWLEELPGQGHDFLKNTKQSNMLEHIYRFWQQTEKGDTHVAEKCPSRTGSDNVECLPGQTGPAGTACAESG